MVSKKEVLEKIINYLDNKISKKEIYEWALNIVISSEYDNLHKKDKLLSDSIHALFSLHHDNNSDFNASREELIIYRDRLIEEVNKR